MDFLTASFLQTPVWMWLTFAAAVVVLLALDLGVLNRDDHEIGVRESLWLSAMYIALGVGFTGFVWARMGSEHATQYITAFVVEKSLSMDNIFVIATIFGYYAVPRRYQHRVLFWGILGVVVLRGVMIALGASLVSNYHWVLYVFAAFLIFTGVRMAMAGDEPSDPGENPVVRFLRRRMRVTDEIEGHDFFVRKDGVRYATPLFLALVTIELADVLFAVDSVPAVFAITTEPYIVYTSNIFAILGLRALYFALAAILHRFAYLKYALSVLLIFIGSKIFIADLMGWEKFPAALSLTITFAILGAGIAVSLWRTRDGERAPAE